MKRTTARAVDVLAGAASYGGSARQIPSGGDDPQIIGAQPDNVPRMKLSAAS